MFTRTFVLDALERAVKSAAQAIVLFWGVGDQLLDAWSIDWADTAGVAFGGAALSILTSIISAPFNERGSASLVSKP